MELDGWQRNEGESLSEFFERIASTPDHKASWSPRQQECWEEFWKDLMAYTNDETRRKIEKKARAKEYHLGGDNTIKAKTLLFTDLKEAGYLSMIPKLTQTDYDF